MPCDGETGAQHLPQAHHDESEEDRNATHSSRIQLPTDTPPQLMPPTKLPASDSRRPLSRAEPDIVIGFVPFPHCAEVVPIESFRGGGALNTPRPPLG